MDNIITIPKNLFGEDDLIVMEKTNLEKITKENLELRLAVQAIVTGELALRKGKVRTFRQFLKSKFPNYAKNF